MGKYIDDLGIKFEKTPQGWNAEDDRQEGWKQDREVYGFDERETWSLDYTFKLWLYERLSMYNEVNRVDTKYHKYSYKGKEITLQECIDRILEGLKLDLTLDDYDTKRDDKTTQDKIDDTLPLFTLIFNNLWW